MSTYVIRVLLIRMNLTNPSHSQLLVIQVGSGAVQVISICTIYTFYVMFNITIVFVDNLLLGAIYCIHNTQHMPAARFLVKLCYLCYRWLRFNPSSDMTIIYKYNDINFYITITVAKERHQNIGLLVPHISVMTFLVISNLFNIPK